MDIVFESTEQFEQELKTFSESERYNIISQVNLCSQLLPNGYSVSNSLEQLEKISLINDYDSSLYSLKVSPDIKAILTIDEDPIFDRFTITLFRVVNREDARKAYQEVARAIYQDLMLEDKQVQVDYKSWHKSNRV